MKVNELMIGDWVRRQGKEEPMKVLSINEHGCCLGFKNNDGYCGEAEDLIEPIPLTDEILKKNLFHKKGLHGSVELVVNVGIGADPKRMYLGRYVDGWTDGIALIKYVHQLQHALKYYDIDWPIYL